MVYQHVRSALIFAAMFCLFTSAAKAQDGGKFSGKFNVALAPADTMMSSGGIRIAPPVAGQRVADKSFWRLVAFTGGSAILDGETTMSGLQHPGRQELNPLLGPHPDRPRFYATVGAVDVGLSYLSYRLKRGGHEKAWKLPLLGATTMHLGGAANNLRY